MIKEIITNVKKNNLEVICEKWTDPGGQEPNGAGPPARSRLTRHLEGEFEIELDVGDLLEAVLAEEIGDLPDEIDYRWEILDQDKSNLSFALELSEKEYRLGHKIEYDWEILDQDESTITFTLKKVVH